VFIETLAQKKKGKNASPLPSSGPAFALPFSLGYANVAHNTTLPSKLVNLTIQKPPCKEKKRKKKGKKKRTTRVFPFL
jgi:hypothetical protein